MRLAVALIVSFLLCLATFAGFAVVEAQTVGHGEDERGYYLKDKWYHYCPPNTVQNDCFVVHIMEDAMGFGYAFMVHPSVNGKLSITLHPMTPILENWEELTEDELDALPSSVPLCSVLATTDDGKGVYSFNIISTPQEEAFEDYQYASLKRRKGKMLRSLRREYRQLRLYVAREPNCVVTQFHVPLAGFTEHWLLSIK